MIGNRKLATVVLGALFATGAGVAGSSQAFAAAPTKAPACTLKHVPSKTCVVRRGDSLWRIARANHTTVARLVQANRAKYPSLVKNPHRIYSGWVLTLP